NMNASLPDEDAIAAAIVGKLLPELEYAAPVLLERFNDGEQLVLTAPPTDLGFGTGAVDSVLLELFKALVPHVKMALSLSCGMLTVVQGWFVYGSSARNHAAQVAQLNTVISQNEAAYQVLVGVAAVVARREGAPVAVDEVVEAIVDAMERLGAKTDDHPRE
ncbi:MAG TPA: hypothetical protein VFO89_04985, partial [Thermoanaerobaculia bacterium]|nr:hypothetical protein [Thermoanaerobaculia bacterium]